jgi:hypothetical protein
VRLPFRHTGTLDNQQLTPNSRWPLGFAKVIAKVHRNASRCKGQQPNPLFLPEGFR